MPQTAMVNGINYSWANITLVLFGTPVIGITKISYDLKQNKKNNYGAGTKPISRGYGNIEPNGSIELYTDEIKKIIAASPERSLLSIPPFDIVVTYGGSGVQADTDTLRYVEFTADGLNANQDDTKLLYTIPLVIGDIER